MRVLFAGSPAIAVPSLRALAGMGGEVELAGVLTSPDSPRGRHGQALPSDVAAAAALLPGSVPVLKPPTLNAAARAAVAALRPDLLVTFAYGKIFGPRFLALFPRGGVNIHPSLLPRHRGPSPLQAAIRAGDTRTGISLQRVSPEIDAGDLLLQDIIPLNGRETAASLGETVACRAAELLPGALRDLARGVSRARPQEGPPTWCSTLAKEDGRIDWNASAREIDAQVRAYTPWPLSFTRSGGAPLLILEGFCPPQPPDAAPAAPGTVLGVDRTGAILVQTGAGVYGVTRLQAQGKKALDGKSFLNGARNFIGSTLGGET